MLINTPRSTEGKGKKISIVAFRSAVVPSPLRFFFRADPGLTKINHVLFQLGGVEGGENA